MSALEIFLEKNRLAPVRAMNFLQNSGVISDNAVTAADVADGDFPAARSALVKKLGLQENAGPDLFGPGKGF